MVFSLLFNALLLLFAYLWLARRLGYVQAHYYSKFRRRFQEWRMTTLSLIKKMHEFASKCSIFFAPKIKARVASDDQVSVIFSVWSFLCTINTCFWFPFPPVSWKAIFKYTNKLSFTWGPLCDTQNRIPCILACRLFALTSKTLTESGEGKRYED